MLSIAQKGQKVKYEIYEVNRAGTERVISVVNGRPQAERAVTIRRGLLSRRGLLDQWTVEYRRADHDKREKA